MTNNFMFKVFRYYLFVHNLTRTFRAEAYPKFGRRLLSVLVTYSWQSRESI